MPGRRSLLKGGLAAASALAMPGVLRAQGAPIRLGDLNSYTSFAAFTLPYRDGLMLAVEEINAAGGILGRRLELVSRDDGGQPGSAVTVANELIQRERAVMLVGTILSNIGLAVADVAARRRIPFLASEPLTDTIVWQNGNRYTFRLRPGTYVQSAMLAEEAAKLPARRWAVIAPNYEYGQSAVRAFREQLQKRRPDVSFVVEQWPALGRIEAGPTLQAVLSAQPEALFNVTFGPDLINLAREGNARGAWRNLPVVSLLTGEPEWGDPLGAEMPEGWIVTGYPYQFIDTPAHNRFRDAYQRRFNTYPRMGSVVGHATGYTVAAAITKAGNTEPDAILAALSGLSIDTPIGPITYRPADQQSTMGTWVGRTAVRDGKGVMVDFRFGDGAAYLPSEEEARRLRPAG